MAKYHFPGTLSQTIEAIEVEEQPFRKIHRLIDAFEELIKFLAFVSIQEYLTISTKNQEEITQFRSILLKKLYTPSLGTWKQILFDVSKNLTLESHKFSNMIYVFLHDPKNRSMHYKFNYRDEERTIKNVVEAIDFFISVRNEYAHGSTPSDDFIKHDLEQILPLFNMILIKANFLKEYSLYTGNSGLTFISILKDNLKQSLQISPFILYSQNSYYLYCDAKLRHKNKLTFLDYASAKKIIDSDSYKAFSDLLPNYDQYLNESDLIRQRLGEMVVGREQEAQEIEHQVLTKESGIWYVTGDPGVGKSAMSIYLYNNYFCDCVKIHHLFAYNQSITLTPESVFNSIYSTLRLTNLVQPIELNTSNPAEIKNILMALLQEAMTTSLKTGIKIVIILDGLDEVFSSSFRTTLDIIPTVAMHNIYILHFTRRIDEILEKVFSRSSSLNHLYELNPLNKNAVRAILWQAVPKYSLTELNVDKVYEKSQGNAQYLQYIVNDILEGNLSFDSQSDIPKDLYDYYDYLIKRIIKGNPRIPVIDVALVFSACGEPVTEEIVHQILPDINLEQIILSIEQISEIVRPIQIRGQQKKYQIFHKSIADYFILKYECRYHEIENQILKSILKNTLTGTKVQFENLIDIDWSFNNIQPREVEEIIKQAKRFNSAYTILISRTVQSKHSIVSINYLYDQYLSTKNELLFRFVDECLFSLYYKNSSQYFENLEKLSLKSRDDLHIDQHIISMLVLKNLSGIYYDRMLGLLFIRLIRSTFNLSRKSKNHHIQLINIVAGFARFNDSFIHLANLITIMLNQAKTPSVSVRHYEKTEQLLKHFIGEIALSKYTIKILSYIKNEDTLKNTFNGNEKYSSLIIKMLILVIRSPRLWFPALANFFKILSLILRFGVRIPFDGIIRMVVLYNIIQQAFPLIFTSYDSPVTSENGMKIIKKLEKIIKERFYSIQIGNYDLYNYLKNDVNNFNCFLTERIFFLIGVMVLPLLRQLWNYSYLDLGTLSSYNKTDKEKVINLMHLLSPENSISKEDENILEEFLLANDAWRNYFAMVSIIIQGNSEFKTGARVLQRMIGNNSINEIILNEKEILNRLRIMRQYFSIFSYMIRRAESEELINEMHACLHICHDTLIRELESHNEFIPYFAKSTLFDQGDPFNPLLPIGIISAIQKKTNARSSEFFDSIHRFINYADITSNKNILIDKILDELVSLSLFYPAFAIQTAFKLFREYEGKDEIIINILLEKIQIIDYLAPGFLERYADNLLVDASSIRDKITRLKSSSSDTGKVMRLSDQIKVFAWHECITTIMVNFPRIRNLIINASTEVFKKPRVTSVHLVQDNATLFLKKYFGNEAKGNIEYFLTTYE